MARWFGGRRCRHEPDFGTALLVASALRSEPSGLLPLLGFFPPQSATDIAQIRELQTQVEDVKREKQSLQEKVIPPQSVPPRAEERGPSDRPLVSDRIASASHGCHALV